MLLSLGKLLLFAAAAVYLLPWYLDARCYCSLVIVLVVHYSFGRLVLFAAAVAIYLLSCSRLGACFCCLMSFICCLGAVYCCCCSLLLIAVVLVMHSLGKLVQFTTTAVAVYLLSWRLLGVRFFYCCRSFVVLVMLYYVNLVLSAVAAALSATGVVIWIFWFVICCVDVPIAEAQH
ncbi:hypothetical protein MAM1_0034c02540 [Mucor ambiguus]|uniref:Uncharacterized protein n=1 Tax=Mucor ambiguus TaxID=91626 RepID=A0A0C9M7Q5_9FUNG|nr:hypothetical protein MAM1_0034c02540 [Mucor ambiguus]